MLFEMEMPKTTRLRPEEPAGRVNLVPVATLVLWLVCLGVGLVGFFLQYPWPRPPPKEPPPVVAQRINVQIADQAIAQPQTGAPSAVTPPAQPQPPAPVAPAVAVPAPPLAAVAHLLPAPSFALAVEGPHRVVDAKAAVPVQAAPAVAPPANGPQQLTYGQGEGRQPAPEYPREAVLDREEGTVIVRFTVDENGHVTSAEASTSSRWPALNHAAVRAVRDTWRFPPGPPRNYEVSIQFQLVQK
jgi:protein TonB